MSKHGILGPSRKRKKAYVDYYDVEDIAPTTPARFPRVHVREWNGTGAHVSAYQYAIAQHSPQLLPLTESQWYSSLFPSAEPTPLEAESWSVNDDTISQYDPVLDEQVPVRHSNVRIRVSLSGKTNFDDCLIMN